MFNVSPDVLRINKYRIKGNGFTVFLSKHNKESDHIELKDGDILIQIGGDFYTKRSTPDSFFVKIDLQENFVILNNKSIFSWEEL